MEFGAPNNHNHTWPLSLFWGKQPSALRKKIHLKKLAAPKKFPFPTVSNHGMRAISGFFGEAIYQRPRPAGPILQQTGQSFGHIKDSSFVLDFFSHFQHIFCYLTHFYMNALVAAHHLHKSCHTRTIRPIHPTLN